MSEGLKVENLSKVIGAKKVLFRLEASFEVSARDRIALVGRSGMGKTSLLRLIAGLEPMDKDSGRIWLGEREITEVPVQKREIGFVFQEQALFKGRSVFENVAFGLSARGASRDEIKERVSEWLSKLGLTGRGRESIDHLSGGERQRVALARALVIHPRLILMDEPFTGLDPSLKDSLYEEVLRLHAEIQVPLLFTSHDEREISKLATRSLIFEESGAIRRVLFAE